MNENTCACGGDCEPINAVHVREDGEVMVRGRWLHRGGCLYCGEVTVVTVTHTMSFSSTTPQTKESLAGYADPEYIARHMELGHFRKRTDGFRD